MTIQIQTEQFELSELYAYLKKQDLPEGITIKYDRIKKEGRISMHELFEFVFEIWDNDWPEGMHEIVKFAFRKYVKRPSIKPDIVVTFKDGSIEGLSKNMGESMIAAKLVEYASTGNLEKVEFN